MDGLLSLLLFAGLFFLMMRFGCGAHVLHGLGKRHDRDSEPQPINPVCGMPVDVNQGYGKMHEGRLYRFCSRDCLDRFDDNPMAFVKSPHQLAGGE